MRTKVEIISAAFGDLGRDPISDIDPSSAEPIVITASKKFDVLVKFTIQDFPWRFATLTRNLNKIAATPPVEIFSDIFQLPADYLNLERTVPFIPYRMYEDKIYTNSNTFQIDYRSSEFLNPLKFPAFFDLYIEYRLAVDMAMPLTQQISIKKEWQQEAKQQLIFAKYQDSQQQPSNVIQSDAILTLHFGSVGRG